jgi:hypothetical protein
MDTSMDSTPVTRIVDGSHLAVRVPAAATSCADDPLSASAWMLPETAMQMRGCARQCLPQPPTIGGHLIGVMGCMTAYVSHHGYHSVHGHGIRNTAVARGQHRASKHPLATLERGATTTAEPRVVQHPTY